MGDIGCYALSLNPPLEAIWTEHSMGASISLAMGLKLAGIETPVIATIGDSTFYHSGIPALIEVIHKGVDILVVILDNNIIAMTGHQTTPAHAKTESGRKVNPVKIEDIVKSLGVTYVKVVNPLNLKEALNTITEALNVKGVKVVVMRAPCAIVTLRQGIRGPTLQVDRDKCKKCMVCILTIGCPALTVGVNGYPEVNTSLCNGCTLCAQICPFNAIVKV